MLKSEISTEGLEHIHPQLTDEEMVYYNTKVPYGLTAYPENPSKIFLRLVELGFIRAQEDKKGRKKFIKGRSPYETVMPLTPGADPPELRTEEFNVEEMHKEPQPPPPIEIDLSKTPSTKEQKYYLFMLSNNARGQSTAVGDIVFPPTFKDWQSKSYLIKRFCELGLMKDDGNNKFTLLTR